jgi:hypothetical protein
MAEHYLTYKVHRVKQEHYDEEYPIINAIDRSLLDQDGISQIISHPEVAALLHQHRLSFFLDPRGKDAVTAATADNLVRGILLACLDIQIDRFVAGRIAADDLADETKAPPPSQSGSTG